MEIIIVTMLVCIYIIYAYNKKYKCIIIFGNIVTHVLNK